MATFRVGHGGRGVEQINRHSEVMEDCCSVTDNWLFKSWWHWPFFDIWPFRCSCCWSRAAAVSLLSISTSMKSRVKISPSSGVVSVGMLRV